MTNPNTPVWHSDADFWRRFRPVLFGARTLEKAAAEAEQAAALLGLEPGARILDLCAGVGRHALALAALGYRVTAVERQPAYIETIRSEAEARRLDLEVVQGDMAEFERAGAFDGALNLFTSFGYFETDAENLGVLRHVRRSLVPGARAVFEMMGKEVLADIYQARSWMEPEPGVFFLEERHVEPGWERVRNRWIIIDRDGAHEHEVTHFVYSGRELRTLLEAAGFGDVALHGSLEGAPYDRMAHRLVAVAST